MKAGGILLLMLFLPFQPLQAQWVATAPVPGGSARCVALSGSKIFAGTGTNLFVSTDHGLSWNSLGASMPDSAVGCLALSGTKLFAGTGRGNLFVSTDEGASWSATGWPGGTAVYALGVDGTTLYMGTRNAALQRSTDDGATWEQVPGSVNYCDYITINAGVIMARMNTPGLYVSVDHGASWTWVATGLSVRSAASIGSDLYVGTTTDVQRSTDGGASWSPVVNGLPPSTEITALAPYDSNLFAAARSSGVFLSPDNGENWLLKSEGMTDTVINSFTLSTLEIYGAGDALWQRRIGEMVLPRPPEILPATGQTDSSFTAHWAASTLAVRYRLDVALDNSFAQILTGYNNLLLGGTSCTVNGLLSATNYFYRVRAVDLAGTSRNSATQRVPTLPLAPEAFDASAIGDSGFTAHWGSVVRATAYHLDISTDSTFGSFVPSFKDRNMDTATSCTVVQLNPGTTYYYQVRAYSAGGASANSNRIQVSTRPLTPSAPVAKAPTNIGSTGFTANWFAVIGAASYRLDVALDTGFTNPVTGYENLDVGDTTSYDVKGLNPVTEYFYRVRAVNGAGTSASSNTIQVSTFPNAPAPPLATAPTNVSTSGFNANWGAVVGAESYRLDVANDSLFASFVTEFIDKDVGNVTTCAVTGLKAGAVYYYRVRAVNTTGTSGNSNRITATTLAAVPAAPTALNPTDVTTSGFTAVWNSVVTATGYELDVSTDNAFGSYLSGYNKRSVGNGTRHFVDSLQEATAYFYRVRAVNIGGTSGNSNIVGATTLRSNPATYTVQTTVSFTTHANLNEYQPEDYRLVGIPGNSGQIFGSFIGGVQGSDWEVYWDNGSQVAYPNYYVRYNAPDQNFTAATGKAFWLLKRGDWTLNSQMVPTATLDTSRSAVITLGAVGYYLITNPFLYTIQWSRITEKNLITDSLRAWSSSGWVKANTFEPYQGYLLFNGAGKSSLQIPLSATLPKAPPPSEEGAWRVDLIARCGVFRDETTSFGISATAGEGMDSHEQRKPRQFARIPDVFFDHPEWDPKFHEFATDIRPAISDVQVWDLVVRSEERKAVELEFVGLERIPAELGVTLLDERAGCAVDLRKGSRYTVHPASVRTPLRVAVGKREVLQRLMAQVLPTEYQILQNYPNPFNPSTTVPVVVPQESFVTVAVYDLLGRAVKTLFEGRLAAGRFYFDWDGRNERGLPVSSGVYFARLAVTTGVARVIRMQLMR